MVSKVGAT